MAQGRLFAAGMERGSFMISPSIAAGRQDSMLRFHDTRSDSHLFVEEVQKHTTWDG